MGTRSDRFSEIKKLFQEVIERPADRRSAYLAKRCGDDAELRSEVEALLGSYQAAAEFIEQPAVVDRGGLVEAMTDSWAHGRVLGPYVIERYLGRGALGSVFMARRQDGVEPVLAALELLRPEMAPPDVVERLDRMRPRFRRLDHPGLATLLDAGVTKNGLPYVVMEYVAGVQIDRHCDSRRLPVADRLTLFLQACDAIEHAHRNDVLHLDVKPRNLVVTATGRLRVIDLGITSLLAGDLSRPLAVRTVTPYASPEQVQGDPVSPATDVYILGVVLYELLTGHHPHQAAAGDLDALRESILAGFSPRPSIAIGQSAVLNAEGTRIRLTPLSVAQARSTTVESLEAELTGYDEIIMRTMAVEPGERFQSVAEFAKALDAVGG